MVENRDDEFDVMKTHAERGGEIIKKTFSGAGDDIFDALKGCEKIKY